MPVVDENVGQGVGVEDGDQRRRPIRYRPGRHLPTRQRACDVLAIKTR
jgi:hypothetical protein